MQVIKMNINSLTPYKNNAKKHPKKQVERIMNSIREFGMNDPIGICGDDNIIVEGHGRYLACKKLGFKEVPCIRLDHLTEEQRKAYTLAHNKVAESDFDWDLVDLEIQSLDIDVEQFGFEFVDEEEEKEKARNRPLMIRKKFNILEFDPNRCSGFFEMPTLKPVDFKPTRLVGFNYAKSSKTFDFGIHFYLDDYQFERLWNNLDDYVELLSKFECVLSPHFSVYADMSKSIRIYNTFRGKLLAQMLQDYGITVIPTVYWGEEDTYDFSFDGLPENGTLSIYTVNYNKSEWAHDMTRNGLIELLKRKKPKRLLIYGNGITIDDVDFGNTEVVYYQNEVTQRMKERI